MLIELSQTENVHITKRAKEDAEKAAAVLTLELGTRAQRRAKKVANRNTAAQEKLKTTGKSLFLIGVATICVWGVYGTATGTLTDVIRMPAPLAYLYFVVLGTTGAFGSVHVWFELGSLLQNRSQAHELYKSVVARPALKHMTDDE